eukprot:1150027-Pelagomonas_calceolata.AAC.7
MVTRCYKNSCNMMGFATLNCLSAAKEGAYRTVRNTELPLSCQAGCIHPNQTLEQKLSKYRDRARKGGHGRPASMQIPGLAKMGPLGEDLQAYDAMVVDSHLAAPCNCFLLQLPSEVAGEPHHASWQQSAASNSGENAGLDEELVRRRGPGKPETFST